MQCQSCAKTDENNPMRFRYGPENHNYSGGYVSRSLGYRIVQVKGEKMYEHRHLMEEHLGRKLESHEEVHHINGDKTDNKMSNLQLLKNHGTHMRRHRKYDGCVLCGKPHCARGYCEKHYYQKVRKPKLLAKKL